MEIVTIKHVHNIMQGCINNDYNSICEAGKLLNGLAEQTIDVQIQKCVKRALICSLYRKFMRAYSRYIINNPNSIIDIAVDCGFSSMNEGRYGGINEY